MSHCLYAALGKGRGAGASIDAELGSGCGVDCEDPGYLKPARTGVWVELASAKAVARCGRGGASGMSLGEATPRPGKLRGVGGGRADWFEDS